jgi:peptide/nickel transport system substrate-binding protein
VHQRPSELPRLFILCGDKMLDAGLVKPGPAASRADYIAAGNLYSDSLCWLNIADVHDTIAARAGLCGWNHELP